MQKEASVSFRDRNRKQTLLYISVTSPAYFPWGQGLRTPSPALDPDPPELLGGHSLSELSLVDTEPGGHARPCWSPGQGPQPQSGRQWPSAVHRSCGEAMVPPRCQGEPCTPRPHAPARRPRGSRAQPCLMFLLQQPLHSREKVIPESPCAQASRPAKQAHWAPESGVSRLGLGCERENPSGRDTAPPDSHAACTESGARGCLRAV